MADSVELLHQAVKLCQQKDFAQATKLLDDVLAKAPDDINALHFKAIAEYSLRNFDVAQEFMDKALEKTCDNLDILKNAIPIYELAKNYRSALATCEKLLSIAPDEKGLCVRTSKMALKAGDLQKGLDYAKKGVDKEPEDFDSVLQFAMCLYAGNQLELAKENFEKAIVIKPNEFSPYASLAELFTRVGHHEGALKVVEKGLAHVTENKTQLYSMLGMFEQRRGNIQEAKDAFNNALKESPENVNAVNGLFFLFTQEGDLKKAIELLDERVEKNDAKLYLLNQGALLLKRNEETDDALLLLDKAIEIDPEFLGTKINYATLLSDKGDFKAAVKMMKDIIKQDKENPKPYNSLGVVYRDHGNTDDAIDCFKKALELDNDFEQAHFNLGLSELRKANFTEGWKEYEWRPAKAQVKERLFKSFNKPEWDGSDLSDKTVCIVGDLGVGEQIMFASMFPDIIEQSKKCIFIPDKQLSPILTRSFPDAEVAGGETKFEIKDIDYVVCDGSLGQYLRPHLNDFPKRDAYLSADEDAVKKWKERFEGLDGQFNVGIAWHASQKASIELKEFSPLMHHEQVNFISLQYGDVETEIDELENSAKIKLHHWKDDERSDDIVDDWLAQISALDLVITVDGSIAHLAGAVGVPVWVLLRPVSSWYWLTDRDSSIWYPSMKLFRQSKEGDWAKTIKSLEKPLKRML